MNVAARPRVLSLCSGYGGLDLAVRDVCARARTVCYVEREAASVAVLAARMADGGLDDTPIWSDLATFDAAAWRGCVDLVVAGFPCQPVSLAGHRRGQDDERWLWPLVRDVFERCGATALFLENVPGIISKGLGDVLRDLAALGLAAEWGCYSAAEIGAPHRRDRWFCLAYAGRRGIDALEPIAEQRSGDASESGADREAGNMGDADRERELESDDEDRTDARQVARDGTRGASRGARPQLADADGHGREGERCSGLLDGIGAARGHDAYRCGGAVVANAVHLGQQADRIGGPAAHRWPESGRCHQWPPARDDREGWGEWMGPQPGVRRGADGTPTRMDRLRMLGNGVVRQQAARALRDLAVRARGRDE